MSFKYRLNVSSMWIKKIHEQDSYKKHRAEKSFANSGNHWLSLPLLGQKTILLVIVEVVLE